MVSQSVVKGELIYSAPGSFAQQAIQAGLNAQCSKERVPVMHAIMTGQLTGQQEILFVLLEPAKPMEGESYSGKKAQSIWFTHTSGLKYTTARPPQTATKHNIAIAIMRAGRTPRLLCRVHIQ
jgi:hypothetical protein